MARIIFASFVFFSFVCRSLAGIPLNSFQSSAGFIENKGQLKDDHNRERADVLFYIESKSVNAYITDQGICYYFFDVEKEAEEKHSPKQKNVKQYLSEVEEFGVKWEGVYMSLKGANIKRENIFGQNPMNGKRNYYLGNDPSKWSLDVYQYQKIIIKSIYPGIDWVLYTTPRGIKYDFEIQPFADPNNILMQFTSLKSLSLNKAGNISIKTSCGYLAEEAPYSYQSNETKIESEFNIIDHQKIKGKHFTSVKFNLAAFDRRQKLIIDPNIIWSSMYGGSLADGGWDVKLNSANEMFVTGEVQSLTFPVLDPGGTTLYQGSMGGPLWTWDSFLMKFNANGILVWSTYIGGDDSDVAKVLALNSTGDVYMAGGTGSTNIPIVIPPGSYNGAGKGAYIMRLDANGSLTWATCLDSAGAIAIAVDKFDNLFITGSTWSKFFPVLNAYQPNLKTGSSTADVDMFLTKFNAANQMQWSTYFGGTERDYANTIATDVNGNVVIAGMTNSPDIPTLPLGGAYYDGVLNYNTTSQIYFTDGFFAEFTPVGNLIWSTFIGGASFGVGSTQDDVIDEIVIDNNNNLFALGHSSANNFPIVATGGAYSQATISGGSDFILMKFNTSRALNWSTYYGGNYNDGTSSSFIHEPDAITVAPNGDVYVAGSTLSTNFPILSLAGCSYNQSSHGGGSKDMCLMQFDNNGVRKWSTYLGNNSYEWACGITVDANNCMYIVGEISDGGAGITFPMRDMGGGAYYENVFMGGEDGTIIKLCPSNTTLTATASVLTPACSATCNGVATVDPAGGGGPYSYAWNTGATTSSISGLCAGTTYTATVTDNCGNSTNATITINAGSGFTTTTSSLGTPCGQATGTASVSVSGSGTYSYIWNHNGATTSTISGLTVGVYSVTISDISGCTKIDSVTVTQTGGGLNVTLSNPINTCQTQVLLDAGNAGADYVWSNGLTTQTANIISSGTYSVLVTDASGCTGTATTQININATPVINVTGVNTCANSITLDAGVTGLTYNWNNGAGTAQTHMVTASGTYTLVVTNSSGCTSTDTALVILKPKPTVELGSDTTLCSTTLLVDAQNTGSSFLWNTGSTTQTINIASSGTYGVLVTGANGCQSSDSLQVTLSSLPVINLNNTNTCATQLTLDAGNAGSSYLWSTSATTQTIQVTTSGTYSIVVTNTQNCSATKTVNIQLGTNPVVVLNDTSTCAGQLMLNAGNPGATYVWNNGGTDQFISVTGSGTYSVTITDAAGCTASDQVQVIFYIPPIVSLGNNQSSCATPVTINAGNSGSVYQWNTGATTQSININSSGTYSVLVTDMNGCTAIDDVSIQLNLLPVISLPPSQSTCNNTLLLDAGNNGSIYVWNTGATSQTISVSVGGTYSVVVTTSQGCKDSAITSVTVGQVPVINLPASIQSCEFDTLLDAGNPGANYQWSNGSTTQQINVTQAGIYQITVTDAGGCSASASVNVQIFTKPVVNPSSITLCDTITSLDAGSGLTTYSWSTGATTQLVNVTASGVYTVTVTNTFNCSATATSTVVLNVPPVVTTPSSMGSCTIPVVLMANGTNINSYSWSNGASTQQINALTAGVYSVLVTAANGCTASAITTVIVFPKPLITLSDTSICDTQLLLDAGNMGSNYVWNIPDGGSSLQQQLLATTAGVYTLAVTNSQGCTSNKTITVSFISSPVITISNDTTIELGTQASLNASGGGTYSWTPNTGLSCSTCPDPAASPLISTTYTVYIASLSGCNTSEKVTVNVFELPCGELYIPTAFSPNGDRNNDDWRFRGNKCIKTMQVGVYDRWGQKVFESIDPGFAWDGKLNGKELDPGVYVFYLTATFKNDQVIDRQGNITIVK